MKPNSTESTDQPLQFLTASELRQRWKVSAMFLWRARQNGKLKAYKIGGRGLRYALADVQEIERQAQVGV